MRTAKASGVLNTSLKSCDLTRRKIPQPKSAKPTPCDIMSSTGDLFTDGTYHEEKVKDEQA